MAVSAALASPFATSAKNSMASSATTAWKLPIPFSWSVTARFRMVLISSFSKGFNSKITERDSSAPFTSKYGFSVVAPTKITVPSSTKGSR